MSTYKAKGSGPADEHPNVRAADARTRGYRRRLDAGESLQRIADAEGRTLASVRDSINRYLPEDGETDPPRGASHGLTRGQVAYALDLPPYAL